MSTTPQSPPAADRVRKSSGPIRVIALMEALSITGPAKNLLMVSRSLAASTPPGAKLTVATFTRNGQPNRFVDALTGAGIEVDLIRERRRFDRAVLPQLREIVRSRRPDIIQTHNIKSHFLVRLAGLHRELPWIAFSHGYTAEDRKMKLYNQLDRWSLRAADRVVAVCEAFAANLRARGVPGERIVVRHNSIAPMPAADPSAVEGLRERLGIPDSALVCLAVGRMSPEKGHADLLEAVAALQQDGGTPDFRLVIVGDGPERNRIEELRKRLPYPEHVILPGTTSSVPLYYSLADLVVLPSHSEGSPNVLLEAMVSGLPIVATRVGGVPEIAQDRSTAILVPPHEPVSIKGGIAELLQNRKLRGQLGARARQWVLANCSPQQYVDSILDLYRAVARLRVH